MQTMAMTISGGAEQFGREEAARALHERELNEQIEEALAELDRGEGIPGEQVFQGLWEKSQRRRAAR